MADYGISARKILSNLRYYLDTCREQGREPYMAALPNTFRVAADPTGVAERGFGSCVYCGRPNVILTVVRDSKRVRWCGCVKGTNHEVG